MKKKSLMFVLVLGIVSILSVWSVSAAVITDPCDVRPVLRCSTDTDDGMILGVFDYNTNDGAGGSVNIPYGDSNKLVPASSPYPSLPTSFACGHNAVSEDPYLYGLSAEFALYKAGGSATVYALNSRTSTLGSVAASSRYPQGNGPADCCGIKEANVLASVDPPNGGDWLDYAANGISVTRWDVLAALNTELQGTGFSCELEGCPDFQVSVAATKLSIDGKNVKISAPVPVEGVNAYMLSKSTVQEYCKSITDAECIDENIIDAGVPYYGAPDVTDMNGFAYPSNSLEWEDGCPEGTSIEDGSCKMKKDDQGLCWDGDGGWVNKVNVPTDGSATIQYDMDGDGVEETYTVTGGRFLESAVANTGCCPSDGAHRQFLVWIDAVSQ